MATLCSVDLKDVLTSAMKKCYDVVDTAYCYHNKASLGKANSTCAFIVLHFRDMKFSKYISGLYVFSIMTLPAFSHTFTF